MLLQTIHISRRFGFRLALLLCIVSVGLIYSFRPALAQKGSRASGEAPAASFSNTASISIPALGNASPYPSAISVSGISGTIPATPGGISVTLNNFSHTFPDDVGVLLQGPNGDSLLLMDGVTAGEDATGVTFTISDAGATALATSGPIAAGTFRPAAYYTGDPFPAPGPGLTYSHPGPAGGNSATFTSVFGGDNPNGTWNLYVVDFVDGDSGGISGGWTLNIATAAVQNVVDFDGDNKTDFGVVRNTGGGPSGATTWFGRFGFNDAQDSDSSDAPAGSGTFGVVWGIASDHQVPEDYDGDNKTDIAVWRPGPPNGSFFYIINSSNGTVTISPQFGQTGDDPSVTADYDGDGKADTAVWRDSEGRFYYRGTSANPGGNITFIPWGSPGDSPAPGDYDGDGKTDFVVARQDTTVPTNQRYYILFANGTRDKGRIFGTATDAIVPGDYDGDGKTDLAIARSTGGNWQWWYRPSGGGADVGPVIWGLSTDTLVQGDYDGDGRTDFAVWRAGVFFYRGTTSGPKQIPWGAAGDYPVANYNVY